jgi:hypothetical protein
MADRGGIPLPEPLAYSPTWPTYGTWLPGDERGWVQYLRGFQPPGPEEPLEAAARMSEEQNYPQLSWAAWPARFA